MTEQNQHHPPTPEAKGDLSLDEVFGHARKLEKRAALAHSYIKAAVDPQTWHTIEHLPQTEQIEAAQNFLIANSPDTYPDIEPFFDFYKETAQEQQSLEAQESSRAHAEAERLARDVVMTTDWDRVVLELAKANQERKIPFGETVIAMRSLALHDHPKTLNETGISIQEIHHLQAIIDDADLRLPEPLPETAEGRHIEGNLREAINDWVATTRQTTGYISADRAKWCLDHSPDLRLSSLSTALKHLQVDIAPLPAIITEAFERVAGRKITDYLDREASFVAAENKTRPNSLFIQNTAEAAKVFGLETGEVSDLVQRTFKEIPKHFTSGLGFVEFIHTADESATEGDAGEHLPKENKIQIELGSYLALKRLTQEHGATPQQAHRMALQFIEETLKHEVGHYVHRRILTIKELTVWQEALNDESTAITPYIHQLIQEKASKRRINKEQFSETWEAYLSTPDHLKKRYPRRHAALESIVDKYKPTHTPQYNAA